MEDLDKDDGMITSIQELDKVFMEEETLMLHSVVILLPT